MKTAEEWLVDGVPTWPKETTFDFVRAIQADALNTIAIGITSMMGAPPWMDNPMGNEILKRISQTMQEVAKP